MSLTIVDIFLFCAQVGLLLWIIQLKSRIHSLEQELDAAPPDPETITPHDLKQLRGSLNELVYEIEGYTEAQLKKVHVQMEALQSLISRIESSESKKNEQLLEQMQKLKDQPNARVVPLTPKQLGGTHKDKDRIIDLYQRGWSLEQIATELRLTRSEVQLVVNLC